MVYRNPALMALVTATAFLGACSDDSGGDTPDASPPDATQPPDAGEAPDAAADPCADPYASLPTNFRPIDAVSAGEVVATGNTATVDATAGGDNSPDNPFIYLKFTADTVTKVDITDVDSYTDDTWDLALKRFLPRVNGGDSGPAGISAAIVAGEDLADVTAVPPDDQFATDDWFSEECTLNSGQLGEPATALGNWYDYDFATNVLTPKAEIYVLKRADGSAIKVEIETYYVDDIDAHYEIEWGAL